MQTAGRLLQTYMFRGMHLSILLVWFTFALFNFTNQTLLLLLISFDLLEIGADQWFAFNVHHRGSALDERMHQW